MYTPGGQTASLAVTNMPLSVQVTAPTVGADHNGPGQAAIATTFYDTYGRPTSVQAPKDALGGGNYPYTTSAIVYDQATGAVRQSGTDLGDPNQGHLNLITYTIVDALGRPIVTIDPNGNITITIYNDPAHEVQVFPGYSLLTHTTTGPIVDTRDDRARGYIETLTMAPAALPFDGNNLPLYFSPASPNANIQSLSRTYVNSAG